MDSQENGKSWFGNICKKVETLYTGIDNMISLESFEYAENQILNAGENVIKFTENQLLTAGVDVRQFCSEVMQEILPETWNDSSQETSVLEETGKDDISSCEVLKKDDDESHRDELAKSNSCDEISVSGLSAVGNEETLEQNRMKATLIPSDILQEASEQTDIGMKTSVCGVDQPAHDGENQSDLRSTNSVSSELLYSSVKAVGGTAEPEDAKVDSLTSHQFATVSAKSDEHNILKNEVPSSDIALSEALNDSTDGPGDRKQDDQTKDNDISWTGMNGADPFPLNMKTNNHDCLCLTLARKEMCSACVLQVKDPMPQATDHIPSNRKFEKEWELIQKAGSEDDDGVQMKSLKQLQQHIEPKSNNSNYFCESDWEII